MSEFQFKLLRIVALPAALLFVADWLSLTSCLQISRATETTVTVSQGTFKGQSVLYLQAPEFGEIRVPCSNAEPLCNGARRVHNEKLRVWLQTPGLLHDRWIVGTEQNGQMVVTPESQASAYRVAKIMWSLGVLASVAVAFVLWYFAPFKEPPSEA